MRHKKSIGLPPGSLEFTGEKKLENLQIQRLEYNGTFCEEREAVILPGEAHSRESISWYDLRGLHDVAAIGKIGETLKLHPLLLEDAVDVHQRPKLQEYENGLFIVIKALQFDSASREITKEQISIFAGESFVVSFQEEVTDVLEPVRNRLLRGSGRIRERGTDYLLYALTDCIVDNYYSIIHSIESCIDEIELEIIEESGKNVKSEIHQLKQAVHSCRRSISPLREAINRWLRLDSSNVRKESLPFVRDLYDHIVHINELLESFRDSLNSLQDLFISEMSYKINSVMQMLTIIATIFIPLSFFAGVFGMNFTNMPELGWEYSYLVFWIVIASVALLMVLYFKRKKWL